MFEQSITEFVCPQDARGKEAMKNPLLVPELREMLGAHQVEEIQDFCESTPPSVLADFLGALTAEEVLYVLNHLSPEMCSAVFLSLDEDVRVLVFDLFGSDELMNVIRAVSTQEAVEFFTQLSPERQERIKTILREAKQGELLALFSQPLATLEEEYFAEEGPDLAKIEIYKTRDMKLERIKKIEKDCWINIANPGSEELHYLSEQFKIPYDFLSASLDIDEIARTEVENDVTLLIMKAPFFDETNLDVLYFTLPVGIILAGDLIVTVSAKPNVVLTDFISGKVRNFSTAHRSRFILQLFFRSTLLYLQYLKQVNNATAIIQKKLEQSSKNKQLIKLLNIEKSLVYFTTSLKSNSLVLERLQRMPIVEIEGANRSLFDDITIETKQAIEMANIYSDILSGMMDAFASIISNNLNIVMKALTSITIIITIPILLASLYGMNVKLPLQDSPYAFLIVIGLSVLASLVAVAFFMKRKWLEM